MANQEPSNSQSSSLEGAPRALSFPNRLVRGNYASSAQGAQFVQINDQSGEVEPAGGAGGADATLLGNMIGLALFGQDYPLIVNLRQVYTADVLNIATSGPGTAQIGAGIYSTNGAYAGIRGSSNTYANYVTDAVQAEASHALTFGTAPDTFSVPGYDVSYQWNALALADGEAEAANAQLFCDFITGSGVIAGYPRTVTSDSGNLILPVILDAAAYTEEIAQNDNVLTQGGVDHVVVGVWDVAPGG